jgi:Bacterial extracellular solute-binding proteins, family 5 Middle
MDVPVLGRLEATDRTWTPTERPVEVAWEPARPLNGVAGPGAGGSSIRSIHQAGTSSRVRTADAGFDAARQAHMTRTPRSGAWGRPRTASSAHRQPLRGRYAHRYGTSPHRRRSKASPGRGGEALPGRRGGRRRPAPGAVPGEYAASYTVGDNYSGHVVGSGPYTRPPTSPDGWRCSTATPIGMPPPTRCARPGSTGSRSRWLSLTGPSSGRSTPRRPTCRWTATCHRPRSPRSGPTLHGPGGCRSTPRGACGSWFLGRTGGAGAIADVRVRQAINYAVDKVAYRDAIAGRFAHRRAGLHHPATRCARPPPIRPLPESGQPGDPAKARALLAEAGYPNVRDRPLVCPAGQTTDELGGQCPG